MYRVNTKTSLQTLEMMLADGEVDKKVLNDTVERLSGNTPIVFATIDNKIPLMERMVALGCNLNKKNKENYIALHFGKLVAGI